MTENILPPEALALLGPESVSQGLVYLVCDEAPNRIILCAGAGGYAITRVLETDGINFKAGEQTAENVAKHFAEISDDKNMQEITNGMMQGPKFMARAKALL